MSTARTGKRCVECLSDGPCTVECMTRGLGYWLAPVPAEELTTEHQRSVVLATANGCMIRQVGPQCDIRNYFDRRSAEALISAMQLALAEGQ